VQVESGAQLSVVQGFSSSQLPQLGAWHVICAVIVSAQLAAGSPSETWSVTVATPTLVQVKVGLAALLLLSVPLDAVQR
jgi:hypothetical protein